MITIFKQLKGYYFFIFHFFLLCCLSLYSQNDYIFIGGYYSTLDQRELCNLHQSNSFDYNPKAERVTKIILEQIGLPYYQLPFVLVSCPGINNAVAVTPWDGIRYIVYDDDFLALTQREDTKWISFSILAHEIGHHLLGHSTERRVLPLALRRERELDADEFSGFILCKLSATLSQAQEAINDNSSNFDDSYSTHPNKSKRLNSIAIGYERAKTNDKMRNLELSQSAEMYFNKGLDSLEKSNYISAIESFTSAITLKPDYYVSYIKKGIALYAIREFVLAKNSFVKALEIKPNYAYAWFCKGKALNVLGDYSEATNCFEKAIDIDPSDYELFYLIGIVFQYSNKFIEAIDYFDKSIKLKPDYAKTWFHKGLSLFNSNKFDDAIYCYNIVLKLNPIFLDAWNNKGYAYSKLDNYQIAILCFDNEILLNPNCDYAWGNKGDAYLKLDSVDVALICYDQSIKINPKNYSSWLSKGEALSFLGNTDEAILCYEKVIDLNPKHCSAFQKISEIYITTNNYEKSKVYLDKSLRLVNSDEDMAGSLFLKCIINKMLNIESMDDHNKFLNFCNKNFKTNRDFKLIESWLNNYNLKDNQKGYISNLVANFKKRR